MRRRWPTRWQGRWPSGRRVAGRDGGCGPGGLRDRAGSRRPGSVRPGRLAGPGPPAGRLGAAGRLLVALAGQRVSGVPATVVDHPVASAYCLAGRGGIVVITTRAVDLLTGAQLAAVLAHEQAHLSARHHLRIAAAAAAGAALPALPLLRDLDVNVRRLLEMHADEIAAHEHDPEVLATALVAVASAAPVAALAAAGGDRAMRIRRLLLPPKALPRRRRMLLRAAAVALTVAPLLLAAAPAGVAVNQPPLRPPHAGAALPPGQGHR